MRLFGPASCLLLHSVFANFFQEDGKVCTNDISYEEIKMSANNPTSANAAECLAACQNQNPSGNNGTSGTFCNAATYTEKQLTMSSMEMVCRLFEQCSVYSDISEGDSEHQTAVDANPADGYDVVKYYNVGMDKTRCVDQTNGNEIAPEWKKMLYVQDGHMELCKYHCEFMWPGCNLFMYGKIPRSSDTEDQVCLGWKRQGCTLEHGKCPEFPDFSDYGYDDTTEFTECSLFTNVQYNACGATGQGEGTCVEGQGYEPCKKGTNWYDEQICGCSPGYEDMSGMCFCPAGNLIYDDGGCGPDMCKDMCTEEGQNCVNKMVNGTATGVCGCEDGYIGAAHTDLHIRTPFKCYKKEYATTCEIEWGMDYMGNKFSITEYKEVNSAEECVSACIKGDPGFPNFFTGCEHAKFMDEGGVRTCYMWKADRCLTKIDDTLEICPEDDANCTMVHDIVHEPFLGNWYADPDKCDEGCAGRGKTLLTPHGKRPCVRGDPYLVEQEVFDRSECAEEDGFNNGPLECKPENTAICPPAWLNWTEPSECSIPKCGTTIGQKTRTRECNYAYAAEGKPVNGVWTVTYAGQNCEGEAMEVVEQCENPPTENNTQCSESFNSPDHPLIEAVTEMFTDGGAEGNALDNNLTTLWTSRNADGNTFNSDAALTIEFKVPFQIVEVYFIVGENNSPDGLTNLCVMIGHLQDEVQSCSPISFSIAHMQPGDRIAWFATFGYPVDIMGQPGGRKRRDLENPVEEISIKAARCQSMECSEQASPIEFGDIEVDIVTDLIDECEMGIHDCHEMATCIDQPALWTCACQAPYNGDGKTCSVCPSDACWTHNTTTNECTLKEDKPECSQLTCGSTSIDITFGAELFGSKDVEFVDMANPPQWDEGSSKFVYSGGFDAAAMSFNEDGTQITFKTWIAVKGNGDKTEDGEGKPIDLGAMAVYNKAVAVGVSYKCCYDTAVTVTSDAYQMFSVESFGGKVGLGSLAAGFSMQLSDNGGKVVMGTDLTVAVSWAVTSLVGYVEFFFNECTVTHDTVEVAIIKDGCYAGITETMAITDTDTRQSFRYKVFKGLGVTSTEQEICCKIQICEKGKCNQPTIDADCPAAGDFDFKYHV